MKKRIIIVVTLFLTGIITLTGVEIGAVTEKQWIAKYIATYSGSPNSYREYILYINVETDIFDDITMEMEFELKDTNVKEYKSAIGSKGYLNCTAYYNERVNTLECEILSREDPNRHAPPFIKSIVIVFKEDLSSFSGKFIDNSPVGEFAGIGRDR